MIDFRVFTWVRCRMHALSLYKLLLSSVIMSLIPELALSTPLHSEYISAFLLDS